MGTDVAPQAMLKDASFVKPGKASWSWINSKDDYITFDEQKNILILRPTCAGNTV
ncbi:hypothetical protein LWM68_19720 [Niabella sp. W65]|nr:hypothetical protein [Niabella sp. W65]MCH7364793.1 hypothetical protein [Niabella sp. W65]ULT40632.1 hypothetical protein KRR40_38620 [Niabella sp. I65]